MNNNYNDIDCRCEQSMNVPEKKIVAVTFIGLHYETKKT